MGSAKGSSLSFQKGSSAGQKLSVLLSLVRRDETALSSEDTAGGLCCSGDARYMVNSVFVRSVCSFVCRYPVGRSRRRDAREACLGFLGYSPGLLCLRIARSRVDPLGEFFPFDSSIYWIYMYSESNVFCCL